MQGNNIAKHEPRNWVVRGRERPRSFGPAAPARAVLVAPAHVPREDQRGSVRVLHRTNLIYELNSKEETDEQTENRKGCE